MTELEAKIREETLYEVRQAIKDLIIGYGDEWTVNPTEILRWIEYELRIGGGKNG